MKKQHDDLIARYLAGEPVEADLLEICRRDNELLRVLAQHVEMERLLAAAGSNTRDVQIFAEEVLLRLKYNAASEDGFIHRVQKRVVDFPAKRRRRIVLALAASLAVVVGVGISVKQLSGVGRTYARVISTESVDWGGREYLSGTLLGRKPVEIAGGFVQLRFNHGTVMTVEGPARFAIRNDMHVKLYYGRAVATVPLAGYGFLIESPDARIVDLGTQFGVDVKEEEDTEVHVLQGKVEVQPQWSKESTELESNQAMRVARNTKEHGSVEAEVGRFLPELPERERLRPASYLHWAFDEAGGEFCRAQGRGLDAGSGTGRLMNADPDSSDLLPERVEGVYGKALYFHGAGDWVQTDFDGIAGSAPRTVAFWVKSMPESTLNYAALGWGTFKKGQVWQISLNPEAVDGALGGLRLGILHDEVVGTTPLQDGQWHHVAVVMYPSSAEAPPTLRKNILLYVDGDLEPTASRSVQVVETKIHDNKAKPLYMGQSGDMLRTTSFCGYMDELYVIDKAMSSDEIRILMGENRVVNPVAPL